MLPEAPRARVRLNPLQTVTTGAFSGVRAPPRECIRAHLPPEEEGEAEGSVSKPRSLREVLLTQLEDARAVCHSAGASGPVCAPAACTPESIISQELRWFVLPEEACAALSCGRSMSWQGDGES